MYYIIFHFVCLCLQEPVEKELPSEVISNEATEVEVEVDVTDSVNEEDTVAVKPVIMKSTKAQELRLSANLKRIESAKKVLFF